MCAVRGDIELPRNLDAIIAFVGEITVDEPIPRWFQLLDELHEVEASATSSTVHLCKFLATLRTCTNPFHHPPSPVDV